MPDSSPALYDPVAAALAGGAIAAAATMVGALLGGLGQRLSPRSKDAMLGFGGGVMLAATSFSLVLPGIAAARAAGMGAWAAGGTVGVSLLAGAALVMLLNAWIPHEHFIKGLEGHSPERVRRAWLFVFAIVLHNLPEGFAIGVGHAESLASGRILTTGIAVQDLPEGLVVTLSLMAAGYRRRHAVVAGIASGLPEPVGALLGAGLVASMPFLLPTGLGFAAGAMLFVISHEIIPESHRSGHETPATLGLLIGFVVMMLLDTALAA
ncbi:ZIP family metal transporter [Lysobacter humi (ex Lee et al. 2017)]